MTKLIKLKPADFARKLTEVIENDTLLYGLKWPKTLEAFVEFTYIDSDGITITLINDCTRTD